MNGFDLLLIVLAVLAVLVGLWKGLARIVAGIAALIVAFVIASRFDGAVVPFLRRFLHASDETLTLIAYVLLFVAVLLAGAVIGWIVRKLLAAAALGWADRLAGGAVGLVAAILAAAFLLLPTVAFLPDGPDMLERSRLAPYVAAVSDLAGKAAPRDLSQRWHERIESLRKRWRGAGSREIVLLSR